MNNIEIIRSKIYEIRGQKVMLDRDIAEMYGVETWVLNQAVKRNSERFPIDFMFQMSDEEVANWKSQIVMSNSFALRLSTLEKNFEELKQDLEEIFTDYNDINEDTRAQLEAINLALADLQAVNKKNTTRRRIGFNADDNSNNHSWIAISTLILKVLTLYSGTTWLKAVENLCQTASLSLTSNLPHLSTMRNW